MLRPEIFSLIREKHGQHSSWAIWGESGARPKDNVGDLGVFDEKINPKLFEDLNPELILVGLNLSRGGVSQDLENIDPFANFHDSSSKAMDFKIRYALKGSVGWGAYMTDIIKDLPEKDSSKVKRLLKSDKALVDRNIGTFQEEISDLGSSNPTIIAFGNDAYEILDKNLGSIYNTVRVTHYAHYISKEKYREHVLSVLRSV